MSIIEEALRRVEGAPKPPAGMPAHTTAAPSIADALPAPVMPSQSRVSAYLIVGIAVGVLLTAWGMRQATLAHLAKTHPQPAGLALVPPTGMEAAPPAAEAVILPSEPPPLRLSGIVTRPGAPLAVINDRIVRVGDVVDEARVVDITASGVTLERNDVRLTLNFSQ